MTGFLEGGVRRPVLFLLLLATAAWSVMEFKRRVHVRGLVEQVAFRILEPPLSPKRMGDGGSARDLLLFDPMGIALGPEGHLYVSDRGRDLRGRVIWRIDEAGRAHAVAGTGRVGPPRVGNPARESPLGTPDGIAFDPTGRLHFADARNHRVLRIEENGRLSVVAGSGTSGFAGDGGPAPEALLYNPTDIRFSPDGTLYIADVYNHRIRRVAPDGIIETVAGTGTAGYSGDGGPSVMATVREPWGLLVDPTSGDLLIADGGNHVVRRVDPQGVITTVAGTGKPGYSGDGGPGLEAKFDTPQSLALDCAGNLFIGDEHNHAVRVLAPDRSVRAYVGDGRPGFAMDGTPLPGRMNDPENLLAMCDGSIFVTDGDNRRVLRVDPEGRIWNVAGRGLKGRLNGIRSRLLMILRTPR